MASTSGVNLAFLGANACYRQIRLEPSSNGPNRLQVCYKSATEDPMAHETPELTTVNWGQAPVDQPESTLIGSMYQSVGAKADTVITDASSWFYDGCNLKDGQSFPKTILGEYDRYVPSLPGPRNADVLAHSADPRTVQLVRHHLLHGTRKRRGRVGQRIGQLRRPTLDHRGDPAPRHPGTLPRHQRRLQPRHGERLRALRVRPGQLLWQFRRQLESGLHRVGGHGWQRPRDSHGLSRRLAGVVPPFPCHASPRRAGAEPSCRALRRRERDLE